jgi:hypothetical protein
MLYNCNRGKNSSSKTGRQLIPLSIDSQLKEIEPLTREEHEEAVKKLKRFFKN